MSINKTNRQKCINPRTETQLLFLGYSRYVSRCHTLFSLFFEGVSAIIFGTIGTILSLVGIKYIPEFNEYYFFQTLRWVALVCLIYGGTVFAMWHG
jgi:hypothetical protein